MIKIILVLLFIILALIACTDNGMSLCEQNHSRDVCFYSLNR